jgi:Xaa-Pro aminopeptidase
MTHDHPARLARARRESEEAGLEAVIVTPSADLVYLIGYDAPQLERLTALVAGAARDPILLVPELERPRAAASPAGSIVDIVSWTDQENPFDAASRLLHNGGRYGVADRMPASHLLGLQGILPLSTFVPASPVLSRLRSVKDGHEIELLSRAARGADDAFLRILEQPLAGRTEREVSRALADLLLELGHESAGFGIVGSGPNGASPHHDSGDRPIRSGDTVVLDFGGRVGGYCSDISRTVSVGEPSTEVKEVHDVVRRAQESAYRAARPGVPAEEVDHAARSVIEEAGYGDAFLHRTGHGIGLDEHEEPYIVGGNRRPLEPGVCFSIEPGIYLEGRFGVRIEDIVALTEEGARRLNEAPRDLVVVA